ncbi:MAG: hypothetical protein OEQ12_01275 [Nitrosopumilus sp.]|nr:hypothetical protein [Nitrosopumilus sp.]
MHGPLFGFLFLMWVLVIIGGAIAVTILGPISISGFGEIDPLINSIVKGIIAIGLSIVWVLILAKLKNLVFRKTFNA